MYDIHVKGITEGTDYRFCGEGYNVKVGDYTLYEILTRKGAKAFTSSDIGPQARWDLVENWDEYMKDHGSIVVILTDKTKYFLTFHSADNRYWSDLYDVKGNIVHDRAWLLYNDEEDNWDEPGMQSILSQAGLAEHYYDALMQEYVEEGIVSEVAPGVFSTVGDQGLDALAFMENGAMICRFYKWIGDFDCSGQEMTTLYGVPRIVTGNFDCSHNELDSLKYAPKKVGGDFDCSGNRFLKSLKYAPVELGGRLISDLDED